MKNVYYNPEEFGLETVGEFEIEASFYSFDIFAVWRDPKSGKFYTATDSGCSCPTPFEDYDSIESLTAHENAHSVLAEIQSYKNTYESPADLISRIMAF